MAMWILMLCLLGLVVIFAPLVFAGLLAALEDLYPPLLAEPDDRDPPPAGGPKTSRPGPE